VTKPKPEYSTHTALVYGCQAAPDLHFSRKAAHTERLSERELERKIRSGEKDLLERAEQSTVEGGDFREMTNTEFDVLFGALDRDNEVQFRVMFTPLAQNNTVDLLRNTSGFGDDFSFYKQGRLNHIVSEHAQTWHMNTSPHHYIAHSVDLAYTFKTHHVDNPRVKNTVGENPCDALADAMHKAWVSFAKTGDPGWSPFDLEERRTMRFDTESREVLDPWKTERQAMKLA